MTDKELLERWKTACSWLILREQLTNTNKNQLGQIYNHDLYLIGLRKLEKIEKELQRRGINYGQA